MADLITITGLTAARMMAIEAASVVRGVIQGDDLILTRRDGITINAGNVRGAQGPQGIPGDINVSPAGGALAGNYPNPDLAPGVITDANVDSQHVDGAPANPSMRTLGTGANQAAAGTHTHAGLADSGWKAFTPLAGEAPFVAATGTVTRAQYRKIGKMVHVRIQKDVGGAGVDMSASTGGNFANTVVMGAGSVPTVACPDVAISAAGRIADSPNMFVLSAGGAITWVGGFPKNYPAASPLFVDFIFFTNN